jgi:hypothetical protein
LQRRDYRDLVLYVFDIMTDNSHSELSIKAAYDFFHNWLGADFLTTVTTIDIQAKKMHSNGQPATGFSDFQTGIETIQKT